MHLILLVLFSWLNLLNSYQVNLTPLFSSGNYPVPLLPVTKQHLASAVVKVDVD